MTAVKGLGVNLVAAGAAVAVLALGTGVAMPEERHAHGQFEVKVTPVAGAEPGAASGRLSLVKTFTGDLVGVSNGDMWTAETSVKGSGGYVAIERVDGALLGRKGSFTLLHQGTMDRGGDFQLRIIVVPGAGTNELEGLTGTMSIRVENGVHFYDLEYSLPPADLAREKR